MNLPVFLSMRFKTTLAGMGFVCEADSLSLDEARAKCHEVQLQECDIELVAAQILLELSKPNSTGCYQLDEESEQLFVNILSELKVGAEHFHNERVGHYDNLNNRVAPVDFGINFPDGTIRVTWFEDEAAKDLDTTLALVKGAAEALLRAQELPYFQQTDQELNDGDIESVLNRRTELLYRAGLWPSSDNEFEPEEDFNLDKALTAYATMNPPLLAVNVST